MAQGLQLKSPEFGQWVRDADLIGKSGRWNAVNEAIVKLSAQPGTVAAEWLQVFGCLTAATFSEYLSLKRAYQETSSDSSLIAWRARNLLELSVWSVYCSRSKENALRLFADGGRDVLNLFDAFVKWTRLVKATDPDIEPISKERANLEARAALHGIESLEGSYKQVSEAAKEVGMGDHFNVTNKLLSKFAHPTAMQIMAPAESEKLLVQKEMFFSHGCLFFLGAFHPLERELLRAASERR